MKKLLKPLRLVIGLVWFGVGLAPNILQAKDNFDVWLNSLDQFLLVRQDEKIFNPQEITSQHQELFKVLECDLRGLLRGIPQSLQCPQTWVLHWREFSYVNTESLILVAEIVTPGEPLFLIAEIPRSQILNPESLRLSFVKLSLTDAEKWRKADLNAQKDLLKNIFSFRSFIYLKRVSFHLVSIAEKSLKDSYTNISNQMSQHWWMGKLQIQHHILMKVFLGLSLSEREASIIKAGNLDTSELIKNREGAGLKLDEGLAAEIILTKLTYHVSPQIFDAKTAQFMGMQNRQNWVKIVKNAQVTLTNVALFEFENKWDLQVKNKKISLFQFNQAATHILPQADLLMRSLDYLLSLRINKKLIAPRNLFECFKLDFEAIQNFCASNLPPATGYILQINDWQVLHSILPNIKSSQVVAELVKWVLQLNDSVEKTRFLLGSLVYSDENTRVLIIDFLMTQKFAWNHESKVEQILQGTDDHLKVSVLQLLQRFIEIDGLLEQHFKWYVTADALLQEALEKNILKRTVAIPAKLVSPYLLNFELQNLRLLKTIVTLWYTNTDVLNGDLDLLVQIMLAADPKGMFKNQCQQTTLCEDILQLGQEILQILPHSVLSANAQHLEKLSDSSSIELKKLLLTLFKLMNNFQAAQAVVPFAFDAHMAISSAARRELYRVVLNYPEYKLDILQLMRNRAQKKNFTQEQLDFMHNF